MKITVVGAGNGGCFTALFLGWHLKDAEVELIYNPKVKPERVGQATLIDPPALLWAATKFNWYNNPIHATFKSGILYEGWGRQDGNALLSMGNARTYSKLWTLHSKAR